jgi:hypothetical protein
VNNVHTVHRVRLGHFLRNFLQFCKQEKTNTVATANLRTVKGSKLFEVFLSFDGVPCGIFLERPTHKHDTEALGSNFSLILSTSFYLSKTATTCTTD